MTSPANLSATFTAALTATQLEQQLNSLLQASEFHDYCPNGLQVDGDQPISHIVTGVTACEALIDAAIERQVQAILVHHGYFWKGESPILTGMKGKRIRKLMQHGISLLAYHLPLDAHPVLGNNAQLASALGFKLTAPLFSHEKMPVGNIADLEQAVSPSWLFDRLNKALERPPLYIAGKNPDSQFSNLPITSPDTLSDMPSLQRIGICTGGAQDMLEQAANQGCDVFISGEISERTTHIAREMGIDYFAAGHHATERGGIMALGQYVQQHWGVGVEFIDIPNPV